MVFLHGGAWRGGEARSQAYAAETFVRAGAHWVVPDFATVMDVGLDGMVAQVRRAVAWVARHAASFGGDPARIYVGGHSSGGHLAGNVLVTDWAKDFGLPADLVKGGLCVSGMYDLKAVRLSARSSYVKFDDRIEHELSPQRHLDRLAVPGDGGLRRARLAGVPASVAGVRRRAARERAGSRRLVVGRRPEPLRDARDAGERRRPARPRRAGADAAGVSADPSRARGDHVAFERDLGRATGRA